ncbi:MAG: hypothetical protein AAF645_30775, partial [Myxococcota bacterium]
RSPLLVWISRERHVPYVKLQHAITLQRERLRVASLTRDLECLPADDARRASFVCADRLSRAWAPSWPTTSVSFSNLDFSETGCLYFGLPSPAIVRGGPSNSSLVGSRIRGDDRIRLDARGDVFFTHNRLVNKDTARARLHDALLLSLSRFLHEAGIEHSLEVATLFLGCARASHAASAGTIARLVPDMVIRGLPGTPTPQANQLFEVKTLAFCPSRYPAVAVARNNGRPNPVDRRAAAIHCEYVAHAKVADERYADVPPGASTDPFRQRLADLGTVRGVIFGAFSEASHVLHSLVHRCGEQIGINTGLAEGARSIPEASAAQIRRIYKTLSIVAYRERARVILDGLQYVGSGSAFTQREKTMHTRAQSFDERRRAYQTATGPFPSPSGRSWRSSGCPTAVS